MKLKGKNIILGITGSIAAYKSPLILRQLVKEGACVKVVLTKYAKEFVTPLTLSTLSQNEVFSEFFTEQKNWNSHVELGTWADLFIVAPATANTIAKMANGICDNLLLTTYLSARCKTMIAPAMDLDMYAHPTTKNNLTILKQFGNIIIEPETGQLASGLEGKGRMAEPEKIVEKILNFFSEKKNFESKKILITAGPTIEEIDPVRYISNYSTGKMGYSIANCLAEQGADVTLISGKVNSELNLNSQITKINVTSANEMFEQVKKHFNKTNVAILAAAVADFTPKFKLIQKIKNKKSDFSLELKPTVDIAEYLGKIKNENQILIGFALETNNEIENAKQKLKAKNFDFIVLNSLKEKGAGFGTETNKISIIFKNNKMRKFELKQKTDVAKDISDELYKIL